MSDTILDNPFKTKDSKKLVYAYVLEILSLMSDSDLQMWKGGKNFILLIKWKTAWYLFVKR